MKSTGWVKISEEDVTELHFKYGIQMKIVSQEKK